MLCDSLLVLCFYPARVAVVKSRDMHWSLLAQRDQRDISLSSLRMLIVADGANPCEYRLLDTLLNRMNTSRTVTGSSKFIVSVETQGLFRLAMPSSTSFRPVDCGQRWSAHVQVPPRQWPSPSAGTLTTLQQLKQDFPIAIVVHVYCTIYTEHGLLVYFTL